MTTVRRTLTARDIALQVLLDCRKGIKSDNALHRLLRQQNLPQQERALATQLTNGALRHRLTLDTLIGRFYRHDIRKASPVLIDALRIAVYQVLFLDRVPDRAAVNECVSLVRRLKGRHLAAIANGVLRSITSRPAPLDDILRELPDDERLAVETSHPLWLLKRWRERFGNDTLKAITSCNNAIPWTGIRMNTLNPAQHTVPDELHRRGAGLQESGLEHFLLTQDFEKIAPLVRSGALTVQNPSQALPCLLLEAEQGDDILDMCAAPGGKTTFLAELMNNSGSITAIDRYPNKCRKIEERARLLGISIISTIAADARTFDTGKQYDRILLDAPCSGSGVLARRPELRWTITPESIDELARLQEELLEHAAELLKPDGILVYATCSIEDEENTGQISRFLDRHPDFHPEDTSSTDLSLFSRRTQLAGGYLTLPGDHEGFDGAFAQRLRKRPKA
ncbi:16S rRNA (cytosine(967)-C(5))-methyltransferase RsmB [Prosthecochloris sp. ZM_2]|uniref:16S rRNA (cytosine(967)-C(5))-methyltransferase RsmB n=1 Tax=Prosthecochloris sp. ZM_2 TaxID=2045206 RepID=UPI000DF818F0|nr:16S rRNA (cytosine(967)-C(5))-methyltransferase RsmB [Prosthecochloris sp. ZM_2]RNA65225.1 16S rRNA (cytosine(967)-C(5))-methyltransferase RsmB [Prosthecochloris sp. ZM_2]